MIPLALNAHGRVLAYAINVYMTVPLEGEFVKFVHRLLSQSKTQQEPK